jgi:cellulose synthase (UDP-forming)
MSNSGLRVELYDPCPLKADDAVKFTLSAPGAGGLGFSGTIVSRKDLEIRIKLDPLTLAQEEALTRVIYSRADTWLTWRDNRDIDHPLNSLMLIGIVACKGLGMAARGLFSKGAGLANETPEKPPIPAKSVPVAGGSLSLWILGALLLLPFGRGAAQPKPRDAKATGASAFTANAARPRVSLRRCMTWRRSGIPSQCCCGEPMGCFGSISGFPSPKSSAMRRCCCDTGPRRNWWPAKAIWSCC